MIQRYEMMVIFDPGLDEESLDQLVRKIEETITASEGGELINTDRWGKKRLAYVIKSKQFGIYVVFEFKATATLPKELDRFAKFEQNVARHMIIKIPEYVLKLKEREAELKASLEMRHKNQVAQADDNREVVDMLEEEAVAQVDEKTDDKTGGAGVETAKEAGDAETAVVEKEAVAQVDEKADDKTGGAGVETAKEAGDAETAVVEKEAVEQGDEKADDKTSGAGVETANVDGDSGKEAGDAETAVVEKEAVEQGDEKAEDTIETSSSEDGLQVTVRTSEGEVENDVDTQKG